MTTKVWQLFIWWKKGGPPHPGPLPRKTAERGKRFPQPAKKPDLRNCFNRISSPVSGLFFLWVIICGSILLTAGKTTASDGNETNAASSLTAAATNSPAVAHYGYKVVNFFAHDTNAFTQGLLFTNGVFYESTGLEGSSSLRKVDYQTGRVLQMTNVPEQYFAEGLALLDGKLFQLTWQHHKAFEYDATNFTLLREFRYEGEGWGLTTDGESLILSDGTATIRFLDPTDFHVRRSITIKHKGSPVARLNELEFVKGEIFANVWQTDYILRIAPSSGEILGVIDLHGLLSYKDWSPELDVLNGIAYDAKGDRLFVTGKRWPKVFEIKLVEK